MTGAAALPPIVCVVGWKDSGKTTVTVALVRELVRRGRRVMTVKHGHGFDLDRPGTDSWLHRKEGGAGRTVLAGPAEVALLGSWGPAGEEDLASIVARYLPDAGVVVAEGYKREDFPKIEVFRSALHERPIYDPGDPSGRTFLAIVTDEKEPSWPIPTLARDDPELASKLAELVERSVIGSEPVTPPTAS